MTNLLREGARLRLRKADIDDLDFIMGLQQDEEQVHRRV